MATVKQVTMLQNMYAKRLSTLPAAAHEWWKRHNLFTLSNAQVDDLKNRLARYPQTASK